VLPAPAVPAAGGPGGPPETSCPPQHTTSCFHRAACASWVASALSFPTDGRGASGGGFGDGRLQERPSQAAGPCARSQPGPSCRFGIALPVTPVPRAWQGTHVHGRCLAPRQLQAPTSPRTEPPHAAWPGERQLGHAPTHRAGAQPGWHRACSPHRSLRWASGRAEPAAARPQQGAGPAGGLAPPGTATPRQRQSARAASPHQQPQCSRRWAALRRSGFAERRPKLCSQPHTRWLRIAHRRARGAGAGPVAAAPGWGLPPHGRCQRLPSTPVPTPCSPWHGAKPREAAQRLTILPGLSARSGPSLRRPAVRGGRRRRGGEDGLCRRWQEPYGAGAAGTATSATGTGNPGEQRGGHEAPTWLGSHRGAEEGLEAGGTELADRPHAAEAGAGRCRVRRGRRGRAGAGWLGGRRPGARARVQGAGRRAGGLPARLEPGKAALAGELQPQEPTRQPQPIPAAPCLHTSSAPGAPAGGSKPLGGRGVWEVPGSPPVPGRLTPPAPFPPRGASSGVFLEWLYPSVLEH